MTMSYHVMDSSFFLESVSLSAFLPVCGKRSVPTSYYLRIYCLHERGYDRILLKYILEKLMGGHRLDNLYRIVNLDRDIQEVVVQFLSEEFKQKLIVGLEGLKLPGMADKQAKLLRTHLCRKRCPHCLDKHMLVGMGGYEHPPGFPQQFLADGLTLPRRAGRYRGCGVEV